jgi:hypothetical protein
MTWLAALLVAAALPLMSSALQCDVAVLGGSAAALATALSAAEVAPSVQVCLTEPT